MGDEQPAVVINKPMRTVATTFIYLKMLIGQNQLVLIKQSNIGSIVNAAVEVGRAPPAYFVIFEEHLPKLCPIGVAVTEAAQNPSCG